MTNFKLRRGRKAKYHCLGFRLSEHGECKVQLSTCWWLGWSLCSYSHLSSPFASNAVCHFTATVWLLKNTDRMPLLVRKVQLRNVKGKKRKCHQNTLTLGLPRDLIIGAHGDWRGAGMSLKEQHTDNPPLALIWVLQGSCSDSRSHRCVPDVTHWCCCV